MVVVEVVEVVVAAEEVVKGVVKGKVVRLCVVGGKVELKKEVDLISSSGVVVAACSEVAVVEAAVECNGAEVGAAYVVMVAVKVEVSVVGFGASELGLAAVLPGMVCIWSFSSRVGVFFVVNDVRVFSVVDFTEGWVVFIVAVLVSLPVTN